jgi:hypothetical protein
VTELVIQTYFDARHGWVTVWLDVQGRQTLRLVLDTGTFLSAISEGTRTDLASEGLLEPLPRNRWLLRGLALDSQPIADLPVQVSRRATEAGVDGLLGLDFLGRYTEVRFHFPTMRLTLVTP